MGKYSINNRKKSKSKKKDKQNLISAGKLHFIAFAFIVCLLLLSVQTIYIKAEFGDEYERKAIVQQVSKSNTSENTIKPNRGSILDRNRNTQALAVSTTVYNIFIDPYRILGEDKEYQANIASKLNEMLDIPLEEIEQAITDNPQSQYKVISRGINVKVKEALVEEKLRHVYFEEDTQRKYPGGILASSLVGFIRGDSAWGLELKYNSDLSGIEGRELRIFDENNNAVTEKIEPVKGNTLITTLDLVIQQEAQKLVAQYGEEALAKNAALMVMNPNTGEILAMAEYPSYDLNDPFNYEKINSEYHKSLILLEPEENRINKMYEICRNFSIIDTYEPGSIYKPLVYAAALEEGLLSEHEIFFCSGGKDVYGTYVPCHLLSGHGYQDYKQAIATSCNVVSVTLIERLGREKYYKYQSDYGIGGITGIDFPGETNTKDVVHGLSALNPVELAVSSMGQGLNTTSLQMLTAFSSVINGGNLMKPYLVSQIIDENGNVVSESSPTIIRKVLSKATSNIMREAMVSVFEDGGTGRKAAIAGHKIGGKTGTAQQGDKSDPDNDDNTLTFMGYFPADNPEYLILSVLNLPENYEEGNSLTIPMVKDLANYIISQKRIPAFDKDLVGDTNDKDTMIIDDFEGRNIAEVSNSLNHFGFIYDISGSGDVVKNQFPAGGSKVTKGSKIYLTAISSENQAPLKLIPNLTGMNIEQAIEVIESIGLVPIIVNNSQTETETPEEPEVSEAQQGTMVVTGQLPKYEIKVPEKTEIIIYVAAEDTQ